MKELSIEEKAKRYDEAIERAKNYYSTTDSASDIKLIGLIFPELKECEDERIRKEILTAFSCGHDNSDIYGHGITYGQVRAWLEKQGEHSNFLSKIKIGDKVTRNEDGVLVNLSQLKRIAKPAEEYNITGIGSKNAQGKLGEMIKNLKPVNEVLEHDSAWSEKYIADVFEKVGLAKIVREQSNDSLTNALQDAMIELSKFLPQQKQEWSEEDETTINNLVWAISNDCIRPQDREDYCDWLKSLKPQNTWKPSEEQMAVLNEVINYVANSELQHWNSFIYTLLKSLREQLKKLREE